LYNKNNKEIMRNRIRELRLEKGLRQKDVAEQLGISAQSLGYYENWVNKPDPDMLIKLADFFEVSIDYLLCREDENGLIRTRFVVPHIDDEEQLLEIYRSFSTSMKELALKTMSCWKEFDKKAR